MRSFTSTVAPQPLSKILFLSPQVGADWYKSPKEVPSWNITSPEPREGTPAEPIKDVIPKNTIPENEMVSNKSLPTLCQRSRAPALDVSRLLGNESRESNNNTPLSHTNTNASESQIQHLPATKRQKRPRIVLKTMDPSTPSQFRLPATTQESNELLEQQQSSGRVNDER